jgi:hypothetical protein
MTALIIIASIVVFIVSIVYLVFLNRMNRMKKWKEGLQRHHQKLISKKPVEKESKVGVR